MLKKPNYDRNAIARRYEELKKEQAELEKVILAEPFIRDWFKKTSDYVLKELEGNTDPKEIQMYFKAAKSIVDTMEKGIARNKYIQTKIDKMDSDIERRAKKWTYGN